MTTPTLPSTPVHPRGSPQGDVRNLSSPLRTLARVLLIASICGAPWAIGAVEPWGWGALMILCLLALILWAVGCAQRGVLRITWTPLYWPFLAFLVLAAVQLLAGLNSDPIATREAVLKLFTDLVFFFLAGQLLNASPENGRALETFGLIVTLLAFALCILGLAQILWSAGPRLIYWSISVQGSPFGPYVNHNDYAGLMEMLLAISVGYILSQSWTPVVRFLLWSGVVLVITSIWMSGSRGGAVALLIEGVIWAGVLLLSRPRSVSLGSLSLLLAVVVSAAAIFSWMVSSGWVGGYAWSVFESSRPLDVTIGDRLRVGVDTLRMAAKHPLMGIGVGCFERAFPTYMTFASDLHWTHAHDDIAEALAETGVPGLMIIVVALFVFFRMAFRHVEERLQHKWGWVQMGATVGAIGLLVHSFVDFNLRIPANAAWFVVCVAIASHPRSSSGRPHKAPRESAPASNSGYVT